MNYMEDVAGILGVKLDEVFYAVSKDGLRTKCRLTKNGPVYFDDNDGEFYLSGSILFSLLVGDYKIEKQWKPQFGDDYYHPSALDSNLAMRKTWLEDLWDKNLYNRGLVFQTKGEAQEACRAMLKAVKK